jgi:hypothetical protein
MPSGNLEVMQSELWGCKYANIEINMQKSKNKTDEIKFDKEKFKIKKKHTIFKFKINGKFIRAIFYSLIKFLPCYTLRVQNII